jgi:hypothetical protein
MNLVVEAISGSGFIHKSKLNTNGTFSVGKTWRLVELRALNVISVCVLAAFLHNDSSHAGSGSPGLSILPCQEHIDGKPKIKKTKLFSWKILFVSFAP